MNSEEFVKHLLNQLLSHGVAKGERVVVAVSGGADSVALLLGMTKGGYDCLAAHCNFHLRGTESMRDMHFVEGLCERLGTDLAVRDFNVGARMKTSGESVEMACRSLRYQWFEELLERERAKVVAVGHHKEDNVETFFLNLLRGSGINGLTGMRPRNGYVVRPMIDLSRKEIEEFLKEEQQSWIEDSTNAENHYKRNKLRNEIIPALEKNFPGAVDAILGSMKMLSDNAGIYNRFTAREIENYIGTDGCLNLRTLSEETGLSATTILYEFLKKYGFNHAQSRDILKASESSGKSVSSHTHRIEINRGRGQIFSLHESDPLDTEAQEVSLKRNILTPLQIDVSLHNIKEFRPCRNARKAYMDSSAMEGNPKWVIRPPRPGDRIKPFGMKGSRLLSDIFNDLKFTASQKRAARVLTRDNELIWLIGVRASALFPVTPATKEYIELELKSPTAID